MATAKLSIILPLSGGPANERERGLCLSLVHGTLDTNMSGLLAVTVPAGRSVQSLMVGRKKESCMTQPVSTHYPALSSGLSTEYFASVNGPIKMLTS